MNNIGGKPDDWGLLNWVRVVVYDLRNFGLCRETQELKEHREIRRLFKCTTNIIGWGIGDTRKSQLLLPTPSEFDAAIVGETGFGDEEYC